MILAMALCKFLSFHFQCKDLIVLVILGNECAGAFVNNFNCPNQCGLYPQGDSKGPNLHSGCTAMTESEQCQRKFDVDRGYQGPGRKDENVRIVAGEESKWPMPWMVISFFKLRECLPFSVGRLVDQSVK